MNGNDHNFTFTSRLVLCCFFSVVIGPMYHRTVADSAVKIASSPTFVRADCPMWSEKLKSVCFLDVVDYKLIKYQPGANPDFVVAPLEVKNFLGCLVPVKTNETKFAIGYGNGIGIFPWDGISTTAITAENYLPIPGDKTRGDEVVMCGKADVSGRLWVGTGYSTNDSMKGMLYSVDESGKVAVKLSNIGVPYAIAWSPDNKKIYYAEPAAIISTEFNKDTGELIGNGTIVFDFVANNITNPAEYEVDVDIQTEQPTLPGGMTVDKDGFLWIAIWTQTYALQIDPVAKSILTKQEFVLDSITSVMFVGPNVDDIYVTSDSSLYHTTKTGTKAGNAFNEVVVNWPVNKPATLSP